jgi:hypothetical protein
VKRRSGVSDALDMRLCLHSVQLIAMRATTLSLEKRGR